MPRGVDDDSGLLYQPKGKTMHFNVKYKDSSLDNHVIARYIQGTRMSDVEWIWIVEANRKATEAEIRQLCAGTWKEL